MCKGQVANAHFLVKNNKCLLKRRANQEEAHRAIVFLSEGRKVSGTCTDDCSSETNGEDFPGSSEGRLEDLGHGQRSANGYNPVGPNSFHGENLLHIVPLDICSGSMLLRTA